MIEFCRCHYLSVLFLGYPLLVTCLLSGFSWQALFMCLSLNGCFTQLDLFLATVMGISQDHSELLRYVWMTSRRTPVRAHLHKLCAHRHIQHDQGEQLKTLALWDDVLSQTSVIFQPSSPSTYPKGKNSTFSHCNLPEPESSLLLSCMDGFYFCFFKPFNTGIFPGISLCFSCFK